MAAFKIAPDVIIITLAVGWSMLLSTFPDTLFDLLDSLIGVFLLLLVVLLALPHGVVPGILVMIAVALTFVERNRRKINRKMVTVDFPGIKQQLAPAPPMSPLEVHPSYEYAEHDETSFYPEKDSNDNTFEPVGESINEKNVIPVISSNTDKAEHYYTTMHLGKTSLD